MKVINLTSHTLNEVTTGKDIPPSGIVVRVNQTSNKTNTFAGIPIYSTSFGELEGLPEAKAGIMYVVSAMALNAVPVDRIDVVAPGFLKRNEAGIVIGCVGMRTKS